MIRRPPRSTQSRSSAASDVYKRQHRGAAGHRRPSRRHPRLARLPCRLLRAVVGRPPGRSAARRDALRGAARRHRPSASRHFLRRGVVAARVPRRDQLRPLHHAAHGQHVDRQLHIARTPQPGLRDELRAFVRCRLLCGGRRPSGGLRRRPHRARPQAAAALRSRRVGPARTPVAPARKGPPRRGCYHRRMQSAASATRDAPAPAWPRRRRLILALVILTIALSATVRFAALDAFPGHVFDEYYYAHDAAALLRGDLGPRGAESWRPGEARSIAHPELGTLAIAAGLALAWLPFLLGIPVVFEYYQRLAWFA